MTPEQAEAGRRRFLAQEAMPCMRRAFEHFPEFRSALLLVAQYWSDEAHDAVHYEVLFSVLDEPDLEAARASADERTDEVNTPGRSPAELIDELVNQQMDELVNQQMDGQEFPFMGWDENGESISLFAAFCEEGCHQDMRYLEAYAPYALFRRSDDGITVEVVGTMKRPWLDGVRTQWEAEGL
ncbi:MAG: hypothetical protein KDK70_29875 [Myxococcales bacterium]|nr:hypothetical protein [Myxococcales bacterium]